MTMHTHPMTRTGYVMPAYIHGQTRTPEARTVIIDTGRAVGLREAADEVRIEARWQTEQHMRGQRTMSRDECIKRLVMVEQILREMADRIEE